MYDFLKIDTSINRMGTVVISPVFLVKQSKDLMIRGKDFYAAYDQESKLWITNQYKVIDSIDKLIIEKRDALLKENPNAKIVVKLLQDSDSGSIDKWHKFCQKQMLDNFEPLDSSIAFANSSVHRDDYISKRLGYSMEEGDHSSFDQLVSALYSQPEQEKIEWMIGSIISGDSKDIQKFYVFYGDPGTGKGTILKIINKMFKGYCSSFKAKSLGNSNSAFSTDAFKDNPLIAIETDSDLSRIDDNTLLNSIVSHEPIVINPKYGRMFAMELHTTLIMGSNEYVKITNGKSGITRRLIDISPIGKPIPYEQYETLMNGIKKEYGAIAYHCLEVYNELGKNYYDKYKPTTMIEGTDEFFNFIFEKYYDFKSNDPITLRLAWDWYKEWAEDSKLQYSLNRNRFKNELKNYFDDYKIRVRLQDGSTKSHVYSGFKADKITAIIEKTDKLVAKPNKPKDSWLEMKECESQIDILGAKWFAQYGNDETGVPAKKWDNVKTVLGELDSGRLHYLRVPQNLIVIDLDIKGSDGNKNFELNKKEAARFPKTYAELSKGGEGIHLHYWYDGDPLKLSRLYDDNIEIKVFTGNSSLRRRLSKCNDISIATLHEGDLPKKEGKKAMDWSGLKDEKMLRTMVIKNLQKEYHKYTKPSVDYIYDLLNQAYDNGLVYDLSDLRQDVYAFCLGSHNQKEYCIDKFHQMKFSSKVSTEEHEADPTLYKIDLANGKVEVADKDEKPLIFFDVEVFPNLFVIVYKKKGGEPVKLINPTPDEVYDIFQLGRFVGFNCRKYDNHICVARMMGENNEQLFQRSDNIINHKTGFIGKAYNLSYTDIYDFSAKKQSLKKFEIELGIHHQENQYPWNEPLAKEHWDEIVEYCTNDVIATEAVFEARYSDFLAREMLVKMANILDKKDISCANDTTNTLTTRIIFRGEKNTQKDLVYTDLSTGMSSDGTYDKRNHFPGYSFDKYTKTSYYMGEEVGEGGYVYGNPGMYVHVSLNDVSSMHPHSALALNIFGKYTKNFADIISLRLHVKHKEFNEVKEMFDGVLSALISENMSDNEIDALALALKIAINSVYGLTSASFDNPFRDARNIDNIVAKRGALFMIQLRHEVEKRGYSVAHCKTDSIKVIEADEFINKFIYDYGKEYGYTFEKEAVFEKYCLVNNAVYICKVEEGKEHKAGPGEWAGTGTQFNPDTNPYVFKTLFSHEPIVFSDYCQTKEVKSSLCLDYNEELGSDLPWSKIIDIRNKLFINPNAKITQKDKSLIEQYSSMSNNDILAKMNEHHNYKFVGKVGSFIPVVDGAGGGILLRTDNSNGYSAVTGSKGYRWLEAEQIKTLGLESKINKGYFKSLVDDAVAEISKYGDFEWFVSDDPVPPLIPRVQPLDINSQAETF